MTNKLLIVSSIVLVISAGILIYRYQKHASCIGFGRQRAHDNAQDYIQELVALCNNSECETRLLAIKPQTEEAYFAIYREACP